MLRGIGNDIVKIQRFHSIITTKSPEYNQKLVRRVLHPGKETPVFTKLINQNNTSAASRYLAGCWAAKEALFKSLDCVSQKSFKLSEWYKLSDKQGKPGIFCDKQRKDSFMLSISHEDEYLVAVVVRIEN